MVVTFHITSLHFTIKPLLYNGLHVPLVICLPSSFCWLASSFCHTDFLLYCCLITLGPFLYSSDWNVVVFSWLALSPPSDWVQAPLFSETSPVISFTIPSASRPAFPVCIFCTAVSVFHITL